MNPQKSIARRRRRLDGMKVFLVVFINYFIPALPGVTDRFRCRRRREEAKARIEINRGTEKPRYREGEIEE
ncbi:unnamed protein product [Lasius platythorax]|uniref:Uncharacterized protein n=1 Tax=Lasius platythorax TaxID=488582 RepID=A0AAV2NKP8_9HYME